MKPEEACANIELEESNAQAKAREHCFYLLVILVGCYFAYYSPGLRGDDLQQHFAYYTHGFERLLSFEIPTWNPYVAGGTPWQAEHHHPYSPIMFISYLVSAKNFIAIHNLLMAMLAAVSVYALAVRLKFSPVAAFVGSLVYMNSGMMGHVLANGYSDHLAGLAFIPLLSYIILALRKFPCFKWAFLLALSLAVFICSAHYQLVYFAMIWLAAWFSFLMWSEQAQRMKMLSMTLAALLCGMLLSVVEWLPRMASVSLNVPTPRGFLGGDLIYYGSLVHLSKPLNSFWSMLSPTSGGYAVLYLGAFSIIAASLALLRMTKLVGFLIVFICAMLLLIPGAQSIVSIEAYYNLPAWALFRKAERSVYLLTLAVSILATIGVTEILQMKKPQAKVWILWGTRSVALLAFMFCAYVLSNYLAIGHQIEHLSHASQPESWWAWLTEVRSGNAKGAAIVVACSSLAAVILVAMAFVKNAAWRMRVIFVVSCALSICYFYYLGFEKGPFRERYASSKFAAREYIDQQSGHFRVAAFPEEKPGKEVGSRVPLVRGGSFALGCEMFTGDYYTPNGFSLGKTPRFAKVAWHASRGPVDRYGKMMNTARYVFHDPKSHFLNYYNLKYIVSKAPIEAAHLKLILQDEKRKEWLYENTAALERAWLAKDYRVLGSQEEILAQMDSKDFNPKAEVLLESEPKDQIEASQRYSVVGHDTVTFLSYEEDSLELEVYVKEASFLVLSENYSPGWSAQVNGKSAEVLPAFVSLRAVRIPAGKSVIKLKHESAVLPWSIYISLGMSVLFMLAGTYAIVKHRQGRAMRREEASE